MQSEVLYGARVSAMFKGVFPLFFLIVFMMSSGDIGGFKTLIVMAVLAGALWQMRGAFKPKLLTLDRYGLVYQAPFSTTSTAIQWPQVKWFEIKGKDKQRKLVCIYLNADNGTEQTLDLGDGWNSDGSDMFADKLEKVRDYLEDVRKRYQLTTQSAAVSAQRPLVEVAKKPAASQPKPQPRPASAPVRSGQVYAQPSAAIKAPPVNLAAKPNASASRPLGWGLLAVGLGLGGASVVAFSKACRDGLCGQSFWDIPDARLWIFFAVWTICLAVIWAGMKKL